MVARYEAEVEQDWRIVRDDRSRAPPTESGLRSEEATSSACARTSPGGRKLSRRLGGFLGSIPCIGAEYGDEDSAPAPVDQAGGFRGSRLLGSALIRPNDLRQMDFKGHFLTNEGPAADR